MIRPLPFPPLPFLPLPFLPLATPAIFCAIESSRASLLKSWPSWPRAKTHCGPAEVAAALQPQSEGRIWLGAINAAGAATEGVDTVAVIGSDCFGATSTAGDCRISDIVG